MIELSEACDLIEKYNRPGPRYTSYPTALQFKEIEDYRTLFEPTSPSNDPISLYVHLPFCETLCWFCACTTVITKNRNLADPYLSAVEKEMDYYLKLQPQARPVEQLHFGGGSPSFQSPEQLDRLCQGIRNRFPFHPEAEISAELDPRTLTEAKVKVLAKHGFNRASFGVQDVNPEVQVAIHRIQPDAMNRQCLEWIRNAGINRINMDLIYGLPKQTVESFEETLETVLTYDPDRLAVFSYAHVPWVAPAQKILERQSLPSPSTKFKMLIKAIEVLSKAGYEYIGMDHFAKKDDTLVTALHKGELHRNFQGYSTKAGRELAAFGMSAIGQTKNAYHQNTKELAAYYQAIEANRLPIQKAYILTDDDQIRRDVIMKLMCSGTVDYKDYETRYGITFSNYFANELEALDEMESDGLIKRTENSLSVSSSGRLLVRNIALNFDAYLKSSETRHAKTI